MVNEIKKLRKISLSETSNFSLSKSATASGVVFNPDLEIKKEKLYFAIFKIATFFLVGILIFILLYVFFNKYVESSRYFPGRNFSSYIWLYIIRYRCFNFKYSYWNLHCNLSSRICKR